MKNLFQLLQQKIQQMVRLRRTIILGARTLWMHRLRSLLTVLGIVFGVSSVIAMLAVGEGASKAAQDQIRQLGSNNIILRGIKPPDETKGKAERSFALEYGLTYEDIKTIHETIAGIDVVAPGRIIRKYVWAGRNRVDCDITGTVSWYPQMKNQIVAQGRFFTEDEVNNKENVCILDPEMALGLFPIDNPLGKNVRVDGDYYKVIGVMGANGKNQHTDANGDSEDESTPTGLGAGSGDATDNGRASSTEPQASCRMYIPLTAAKSRFGETLMKRRSGSFEAEKVELHEAIIKVQDQQFVIEISQIVADILAKTHKKKDYEIIVPLKLLRQAEQTKQLFNIVLGAIAGISLLVGGIGIMNIMLATVSERTREIGIRRALGAKRRDIIVQFLVETIILSGAGGMVGVVLGIAIPFVITYATRMTTVVTFWSPILAFSISGLVGVIFGIYPAMRAANMDPVEALRHE